jgi:hypothetical protein
MLTVTPKAVSYGNITVTDWQGRSQVSGTLTGPPEGGLKVAGKTFDEAVAAARAVKNVVDPGLRAVVDAGHGALLLRPVEMSPDAANLFGSRSYGSAIISDAQPNLLGIFNWAHDVPVIR